MNSNPSQPAIRTASLQPLAKLSRPRLYAPTRRQRLIDAIDTSLEHPALWVSGPPGSGKTTLIADYLEHRGRREIWYQLDDGDSDLPTFFYYLGRAIGLLGDGTRQLPVFAPEYMADIWSFARRFFQDMFALVPKESILVLDNLNAVKEDSLLFPVLETAIAQIPLRSNIILVGRFRPPPAFSKALVSQSLRELTWEDLRFTEDESVAFATSGSNISVETARSMHHEMGGWVAGLVLIRANSERRPRGQVVTTEASMPHIFDYFASEVFDQLPLRTRHILVTTSLLSEITESIADELCEFAGAHEVFRYLSRLQFFVDKRQSTEISYRFHDLFRAFLQEKLATEFSNQQRQAIRVRAARVLEERRSHDEAIALYLQAREFSSASRLILESASRLFSQGRWKTVRSHIECLPREQVNESAWLLYWLGCALMQSDLGGAMALHAKSYEEFKLHGDTNGMMLTCACLINAIYFEYDDFTRMNQWMAALDELVQRMEASVPASTELAALDAVLKGAMFCMPTFTRTKEVVDRIEQLLATDVDVNQRVSAFVSLMTYASLVADYGLGERLTHRLADALSDPRLTPMNQAYWWLFVGYFMHVKGDSRQCIAAFERSDSIAKEYGLKQTEMLSTTFRSYEDQVSGDVVRAKATLAQLRTLIDPLRVMDRAQFHLSSTLFHLMDLEGEEAAHHARLAMEAANKLGSPFFRDHWMWYCAAGLAANNELEEASDWMDKCMRHAKGTYNERHLSGMLTVQAFIALKRGDLNDARTVIREMLETARFGDTETFIRMTLGLKDVVLRAALKMGINRDYVCTLIRSFGVPAHTDEGEGWPWRLRIYTLGKFRLVRDDLEISWPHKTPKKPLALLKALIAFGEKRVAVTKLQDALWPDLDGDAARSAFDVALHRLRKIIGVEGLLVYVDGTLSIDHRYVWTDIRYFLELPSREFNSLLSGDSREPFKGDFLEEDQDQPWAALMRARLRRRREGLFGKEIDLKH